MDWSASGFPLFIPPPLSNFWTLSVWLGQGHLGYHHHLKFRRLCQFGQDMRIWISPPRPTGQTKLFPSVFSLDMAIHLSPRQQSQNFWTLSVWSGHGLLGYPSWTTTTPNCFDFVTFGQDPEIWVDKCILESPVCIGTRKLLKALRSSFSPFPGMLGTSRSTFRPSSITNWHGSLHNWQPS